MRLIPDQPRAQYVSGCRQCCLQDEMGLMEWGHKDQWKLNRRHLDIISCCRPACLSRWVEHSRLHLPIHFFSLSLFFHDRNDAIPSRLSLFRQKREEYDLYRLWSQSVSGSPYVDPTRHFSVSRKCVCAFFECYLWLILGRQIFTFPLHSKM